MTKETKRHYPELLSIEDVAEMLGVGIKAIRSWTAKGAIPAPKRFVGFMRWVKVEMEAWLAAGCPQPAERAYYARELPENGNEEVDKIYDRRENLMKSLEPRRKTKSRAAVNAKNYRDRKKAAKLAALAGEPISAAVGGLEAEREPDEAFAVGDNAPTPEQLAVLSATKDVPRMDASANEESEE